MTEGHSYEPIKVVKNYKGDVHQATSGQWAWVIYKDDQDYCRGAGYASESEAEQAMVDQLLELGCEFD